ncbi:hypothetical protein S40293_10275 [Stachybotrys chartarum IBT 40293]|nr:hypothetical protein S40293_10275 [Stachybotrys chartarum IBT 40293]
MLFGYVWLQTWINGPHRKYWVIECNGSRMRPVGKRQEQHRPTLIWTEKSDLERRLSTNSRTTEAVPLPTTLTFAEMGPWIERTGWEEMPRWRADCPAQQRALYRQFATQSGKISDAEIEDEKRIETIVGLFDKTMDRCEDTVRKTSRGLLCWLRNISPSTCYQKPFSFVIYNSTTRRYRLLFKRCLALVLRAYRMSPEIRRMIIGARLSQKQLHYLERVWHHAYWEDIDTKARALGSTDWVCQAHRDDHGGEVSTGYGEDDENAAAEVGFGVEENWIDTMMVDQDAAELEGEKGEYWTDSSTDSNNDNDDCSSDKQSCNMQNDTEVSGNSKEAIDEGLKAVQSKHLQGLLEAIFGLSLSLCTQSLVDGQPSSTILVFASSIFGFSPGASSFLAARSYTSHLSSLIYIQRLLLLEYALPLERLEIVRKKHMILGAQSPFEEMLSLRAYGRVIARSDAPAFLFRWSDDLQTVFGQDTFQITTEDFRRLPRYFINQAEEICNDMMFDWRPIIDLGKIKDDMTNTATGFSFVRHPDNGLQAAYLQLLNIARTAGTRGLLLYKYHDVFGHTFRVMT